MALPVPRGGNAGGRVEGRRKIHRKQAEHDCAVHCDASASGPVRGGTSEGGHEGPTKVGEPDGHRLGGGKSKGRGRGDRQYQQFGVEYRRGTDKPNSFFSPSTKAKTLNGTERENLNGDWLASSHGFDKVSKTKAFRILNMIIVCCRFAHSF